jgi:hypothetical protein
MKANLAMTLVVGALLARPALASDHIDGIETGLDMKGDLTDAYAFVSPQDPDKLVLILNVHPLASSFSKFSTSIDYVFKIREVDPITLQPDPAREQAIKCSFSPVSLSRQQATCSFALKQATPTISFATRSSAHRAGGSAQRDDVRVFAGVRSDPWFLDLAKTLKFNQGVLPRGGGVNGLHGANVLSIVVELDKSRLGGPMLAVSAQARKR